MKSNQWYPVRKQSLAKYARHAGFDLAMYSDYSGSVKNELRKKARDWALFSIAYDCNALGFDISSIQKGVYVISLSYPLSIQYLKGRSQIIYIGIGNILGRIKTHFDNKLFDFMLNLSGAEYDFYFAQPALAGTANYYRHVEHLMLQYFTNQYGGIDDRRRFPILNKNAGSDRGFSGGGDWWKAPLKVTGKKPLWEIAPTEYSDFAPLDNGI